MNTLEKIRIRMAEIREHEKGSKNVEQKCYYDGMATAFAEVIEYLEEKKK